MFQAAMIEMKREEGLSWEAKVQENSNRISIIG